MAPFRKTLRMPKRGREAEEFPEMSQAGRSGSILEAERNSAEIRSQLSSVEATRRNSSSSGGQLQRTPSTPSMMRRASYVPIVPSPLNPSSSQSSMTSDEERTGSDADAHLNDSSSSGEVPRRQSTRNVSSNGSRRGGGPLAPVQFMRHSSSPLARPNTQRSETPKNLKDLGRDYSRYPFPDPERRSRSYGASRPLLASSETSSSLLRTTTTNPFSDSQANLEKWGYPDDRIGTFDPYFGGEKGFILYSNELEADDKFHLPADDDDITFKPHWKDYWNCRSVVSGIGGILLIMGLATMFIVLPVLTFSTNIYVNTGPGRKYGGDAGGGGSGGGKGDDFGPAWAHVNNNSYDLLKNFRTGLIDPDTPDNAKTRPSTFDDTVLELVFSDEFTQPNRTFFPGDDPYWTAPDIWYGATQDMEWYDPDAVTTSGGTLQLRMDAFPNHNLQYRSGMLNSWNQMCFKGGVLEVSVSLAGPAGIPGLWPGVWTMGNLGRPGYKATTEGIWPYTYNTCDVGITPNQSSTDGLSFLPGQKLNSCTCKGEDHPSPGTGRGAPEIDVLEGSVDPNNRIGVVTQSFQVAPFDIFYRPNADFMQMPNYETTNMNAYCGGPYQQAISATTLLNNDWYDGNAYQKYAFEYIPGTSEGKLAWFVGEDQSFMMDGRAIGPNGNIAARQISEEPMSMVMNLGISGSWSEILLADLKFPTIMHIDYVRVYQRPGETSITCDPPGYPTTEYIANHPEPYNNPNLTAWNMTGYSWPKNEFTGC